MAATDTLSGTKSLGNVRALASQMRAGSGPGAESVTQLQQQIDKLLGLTKDAVATLVATIPVPPPVPSTTPPGDVTGVSVTGSFDPISGYGTILLSVSPPAPPFDGCHIFIEVPDQSSNPVFTIGTSSLGGTDAVAGRWSPIDLGQQPYVATQQPWILTFPLPDSVDRSGDLSCRIDVVSYTTVIENALVQAGHTGASPNAVFTLTRRVSNVPGSGTNVTANVGAVVATALTPDNSTGKLKTPVMAIIGSAPVGITGWVGQLVLTYGSADPTNPANQFPVGPLFTTAGPVYATHDGISVTHSFAVDTPTSVQNATVWARTGLVDANGNYQWNNIIPNVTPSSPITLGTTTGTIDAASVLLSSINSTMAVTASLFGVANNGIATINIQALAITNPLLASLAVDAAKLATGAVTATKIGALAVGTAAIQLLAVDSTIIANASVSAAKIVNATITSTQIASATIVDANIANVSASKITAGTISATISITSPLINGGTITGATMALTANGITTTINNATSGLAVPASLVSDDGTYETFVGPYLVAVGPHGFPSGAFYALMGNNGGAGRISLENPGTGDVLLLDTLGFTLVGGHTPFTGSLGGGRNCIGGIIY